MKEIISIITVVKDGMPFLVDCIKSFQKQVYKNKEHIILVSKSSDNTQDYLKKHKYKNTKIIFYKNKTDLYKSLNTAVRHCKGKIIGYLHSDDIFFNKKTLNLIANNFSKYDYTYGNVSFIKKNNVSHKIRSWNYGEINTYKIKNFLVPPHTSMFFKKKILLNTKYNEAYKISSDFDFLIRIIKNKKLKGKYINNYICKMRYGGKSTSLKYSAKKIIEDYTILRKYNKYPFYLILFKYLVKIKQFSF